MAGHRYRPQAPAGTDWRTENTAGGILAAWSRYHRLAGWQRGSTAL